MEVEQTETSTEESKKRSSDILEIVSNHSEQSTATTYEPNSEETTNNECDDYDEDNFETALESFEAFTRIRRSKRATEEVLHGTDWESVNYSLTKLQCNEDEITGMFSMFKDCFQLKFCDSTIMSLVTNVTDTHDFNDTFGFFDTYDICAIYDRCDMCAIFDRCDF